MFPIFKSQPPGLKQQVANSLVYHPWLSRLASRLTLTFIRQIELNKCRLNSAKKISFLFRNKLTQQTFVLMKTSWRRLQHVLIKTNRRHRQDVFKTSWSRRLQDVFKTSLRPIQGVFKTFWRALQAVFKTSSRRLVKISSRRFQGVPSS